MKNLIKRVSLVLLVGVSSVVSAQSVTSLEINMDPRATAMGGSALALSPNAFSIYQNNAAIAFSDKRTAFAYSYTDWFAKNKLHTVSGFYNFQNNHSVSLGLRYMDGDQIKNSEDGMNFTTVNPYDFILDLGYAYRINEYWSLSTTVRYLHSKVNVGPGIKRGNAYSFDVGLNYRDEHFSATAGVQGVGSRVDYGYDKYQLPAKALLGFAYTWDIADKHQLISTLEGDYRFMPSSYRAASGGAGVEYLYNQLIAVRGGYRIADKNKSAGSYGALGCGLYLGCITADFTYVLAKHDSVLKDVWQIAVGFNF